MGSLAVKIFQWFAALCLNVCKFSNHEYFLWPFLFVLQALGDMVESIAGAILIDTKLNLDEVWKIFEPLLSPIVTPDKLELHPVRELIELCDSLGYYVKDIYVRKGEMVHVELSVGLEDAVLIGKGHDSSRKAAKGEAARRVLKQLEVCWCSS